MLVGWFVSEIAVLPLNVNDKKMYCYWRRNLCLNIFINKHGKASEKRDKSDVAALTIDNLNNNIAMVRSNKMTYYRLEVE